MTLTALRIRDMLGGGLAVLLALGTAQAQERPPTPDLEKAGWTLVTASDDTWVYMRAASPVAGDLRRVWTAYDSAGELQRDGFAFRSVRSLGEFDCRRRLTRVVDEFFHAQSGLTGRSWRSPMFRATPWAAPAAESVGAIRMAFACRTLTRT